MKHKEELINLWYKFKLNESETNEFINMILPIYRHNEFQKRLDYTQYPHHNLTSLGMHILIATILTYKYINKYNKKCAVLIAIFHDLYELPWQNSKLKKTRLSNLHGFIHPIEACINAYTWFLEYFTNKEETKIIIDGIIHHMYPFPVRRMNKNNLELNNEDKYNKLPKNIKEYIIESTNRSKIFNISLCKSKYKEGRIINIIDKKTTLIQDKLGIRGFLTLITGKYKKRQN